MARRGLVEYRSGGGDPAATQAVRPIDRIVVHHSASPRSWTLEEITRSHKLDRGWDTIGYHLVIEADGKVRAGRDLMAQGAHAVGYNAHSIGVCVVGNNTRSGEQWNEEQKASLQAVISTLCATFPGVIVCGHKDVAKTECPGLDIRRLLGLRKAEEA